MKFVDGFGLMTRVGAGAPFAVLSNTAIVDGDAPSIALGLGRRRKVCVPLR